MYEFWYDYVKAQQGEIPKLRYMNTESFIGYIITDDMYKDIAKDVEARVNNSNFELDKTLPKGKK